MERNYFSSNLLRWIALISMTIDHAAWVLRPSGEIYWIMRGIGRFAFPIYAFLLVQGNLHTRSRLRYSIQLGVFALISELPFNLAHAGQLWDPDHQNVFVTLFLAELMLWILSRLWIMAGVEMTDSQESVGRQLGSRIPLALETALLVFLFMMVADYLKTDYSGNGILLIALAALLQPWNKKNALLLTFLSAILWWGSGSHRIQLLAAAAFLIPLAFYNGKPGKRSAWMKYLFYVYYPLHLLILTGIKWYLI